LGRPPHGRRGQLAARSRRNGATGKVGREGRERKKVGALEIGEGYVGAPRVPRLAEVGDAHWGERIVYAGVFEFHWIFFLPEGHPFLFFKKGFPKKEEKINTQTKQNKRESMFLSLIGSVVALIERLVDRHTEVERELDDLVVRVDALERAQNPTDGAT
jgi:hypothetical protein